MAAWRQLVMYDVLTNYNPAAADFIAEEYDWNGYRCMGFLTYPDVIPGWRTILVNLALESGDYLSAKDIVNSPGFNSSYNYLYPQPPQYASYQACSAAAANFFDGPAQAAMLQSWAGVTAGAPTWTGDDPIVDELYISKNQFDVPSPGGALTVTAQYVVSMPYPPFDPPGDCVGIVGAPQLVGAASGLTVISGQMAGIQQALVDIGMNRVDVSINNGSAMYSLVGGTRTD